MMCGLLHRDETCSEDRGLHTHTLEGQSSMFWSNDVHKVLGIAGTTYGSTNNLRYYNLVGTSAVKIEDLQAHIV